jgi:HK97 family phage prohead protease
MKFKRQTKLAHGVEMLGLGEIKSQGDKVIIEGLANKNVLDRGRDIIEVDAWDLDNYKKNPVILFNHGMDATLGGTPVGKAIEVKPTENGLFIKVELSNLDDPVIKRIRGLVKERILRAFSVGFDPKEMEPDKSDSSINRIKKAELFEVSIVGVPMNQDSLFEVSGKMIKRKSLNVLKRDILQRKGAWVAGAVHNRIYEMQKEGVSRDSILDKVAEEAGVSSEELMEVLAGNVTPVPKEVLQALSTALTIDMETLERLDSGDMELEPKSEDSEEEVSDPETGEKESETDGSEDSPDETDMEEDKEMSEDDEKEEEKSQEKSLKQADQTEMGVMENNSEIAAANTEAENNDFGSPFLDALKQSNVLLGTIVNELQLNRSHMTKLISVLEPKVEEATQEVEEPAREPTPEPVSQVSETQGAQEDDSHQKRLDLYAKRLKNMKQSLERAEETLNQYGV